MTELFQIFIDNIAPILIVAAVGYIVGRQLKVEPRSTGQLIFYVFSPALVFHALYTTEITGNEFLVLFAGMAIFQFIMGAVAYIALYFQQDSRADKSAVMLSTFCLNAGNYGLSLASFAFGEAVLARAVIIYVANTIMNYTFGVFIASSGRETVKGALLSILRVPAVYVVPAAFILRATVGDGLPPVVLRSVKLMADAAIPAMLILLGLQLNHAARLQKLNLVGTGTTIKLLVAPCIAVALAALFNLDLLARTAFIMQCSTPTAVITLVMASEYNLDEGLSLNLVMVTTLLSPLTLSVVIYLLQQGMG